MRNSLYLRGSHRAVHDSYAGGAGDPGSEATLDLLADLGRVEGVGFVVVSGLLLGLSFVYSRLVRKPEAVAEKSGTTKGAAEDKVGVGERDLEVRD